MKCGTTLNPSPAKPTAPPIKSNARTILAVVASALVLLLVAAIAIPNLIRARIEPGERSGASSVRTLMTAEIQYEATYGQFAPDIKALGGSSEECNKPTSANACLIEPVMANSSPATPKGGYYYVAKVGPTPETFVVGGIPLRLPNRSYCAVEDGVVRVDARGSSSGPTSYTACKALPPLS